MLERSHSFARLEAEACMSAKYHIGQMVKIVSRGKFGPSEIEQRIGDTGKVVDSYQFTIDEIYYPTVNVKSNIHFYYCYAISCSKDAHTIRSVPEEALEVVRFSDSNSR